MALKQFEFEYEIFPDRYGNSSKKILLQKQEDKYFVLYFNGDDIDLNEVSDRIDIFFNGLYDMNINEWNNKHFDEPNERYPSGFWKLKISTENINVLCNGIDNFPDNWNEFVNLLKKLEINEPDLPHFKD